MAAEARTKIPVLKASDENIRRAGAALRAGRLVVFPTETVYGLGGDATNAVAVASIFAAKGRPIFNPLISHVPDVQSAAEFGVFDDQAMALAEAFWPGPLTLIVPRAKNAAVAQLTTAGLETIAIRVPAHPIARALLKEAGLPLAAPSANVSGRISPTRADHVTDLKGDNVEMILDGGACEIGLESTILYCAAGNPRLLRPGGISRDKLETILKQKIAISDKNETGKNVLSPGQLASHYAPNSAVRLNATAVQPGEALLAFGAALPDGIDNATIVYNLSSSGNLNEAAANLFDHLHKLDRGKNSTIAVIPIPETGLGIAINDRLRRAAAPRENSA